MGFVGVPKGRTVGVIAEAVEVSLGEAGLGKHQAEFDSGAANKEDMVANVNRRYSGAEGKRV